MTALTVKLGVRWELMPPFVDKNGIQANFDPRTNAILVNKVRYQSFGGPVPAFLQFFNACNAAPAAEYGGNRTGQLTLRLDF